jgi:cyanophycinase-like exopeptidase
MKPLRLPRPPGGGWIVLIGGGEFSFGETRAIDELMISKVPAGNPRVAFLPTASGSVEYGGHFATYLQTLAPHLQVATIPIYRPRDARRGKNLAALGDAGLIYVGGGMVNLASESLREAAISNVLRESLAAGAVVAGIAAGAASLGAQGAGIIERTVIQAPFDATRDQSLRALTSLPDVETGVGIPARCALFIAPGGEVEIEGEGQIAVMRRGATAG